MKSYKHDDLSIASRPRCGFLRCVFDFVWPKIDQSDPPASDAKPYSDDRGPTGKA